MTRLEIDRVVQVASKLAKEHDELLQLRKAVQYSGSPHIDYAAVAKLLGFSEDPPKVVKAAIAEKVLAAQEEILDAAVKAAEESFQARLETLRKLINEIPK